MIFVVWYLIRNAGGPPRAGGGRRGRTIFVP